MKARTILVESLPATITTLYTVPPNTRAKWVLAFVSNSTGSSVSGVSIEISNSETITVFGAKVLQSGDFIRLEQDGGYVILDPGYSIQGKANSPGVSCILTLEETSFVVSTS